MFRILIAFIILASFSRIIPLWCIAFMTLWGLLSRAILNASVDLGFLASTDPTIIGRFLLSMLISIIIIMASFRIKNDSLGFGILATGLVLTIGLSLPIF